MIDPEQNIRKITPEEYTRLESQGCEALNWNDVDIQEGLELGNIRNVKFSGPVTIYRGVTLRNIGDLGGCSIRENAILENIASLEFEPEALHGVGVQVAVLDETGTRSVPIYPGLSSQIATLMARDPRWRQKKLETGLPEFLDSKATAAEIGEGAVIKNCGQIKNVSIGNEVVIEGASRLVNGTIINNASSGRALTYVGSGVEAENFILEDGRLESKASILNCYVGQGCVLSHGFSAQDSIFFANSSMENGEAHALLSGPYSVSMHKGTLLIGCQTSFMNAGSSTNQSNHMYKLGPVHWGLLERGVKTSSGSYLMLGAKIGAFSLLMGSHKTHPDSSEFPFSYLFGDERGATVVVPAVMLRSCGLLRDEMKWPTRDKRLKRKLPLHDRITFNVLNPFTVDAMLKAIPVIEELLSKPADDDLYVRYKGMKFTRAALERAKNLYSLAIFKYLSMVLPDHKFPRPDDKEPAEWIDLGGQIMPREYLNRILQTEDISETEKICDEAMQRYDELQLQWIASRFGEWWREREHHIQVNAEKFDEMVEEDRQQYLQMLDRETEMLSL
ncbi:MAG: DUF4954 family protein [Muribaculaceae bacterium]|nr:DUF4954 family protein [Muribaculaceae bacterium]